MCLYHNIFVELRKKQVVAKSQLAIRTFDKSKRQKGSSFKISQLTNISMLKPSF